MRQLAARQPSAILFGAQLAAILVYPFVQDNDSGQAIFSALGIAILGLVLLAVRGSPAWTWLGIVLAVPATGLLLIQVITSDDSLLPYSSALEAVLYFYAAGALIAYMLADHEITRDEIWAIGATFTLLAWGFAYAYTVCQAIEPDSFTAAVNAQDPRSWTELLFLSFTTLTSTGLGDVIPVKPFARSLVMVEQCLGLAYIAMLVSRVIGLLVISARGMSASGTPPDDPRRRGEYWRR
jgi:hypothetical protein